MLSIEIGRLLRNVREALRYPLWCLKGKPAPDNHFLKLKRVKAVARAFKCRTFIETGTFFGQTIAAVKNNFESVLSVELSNDLYIRNARSFAKEKTIKIFNGDSTVLLEQMIELANGPILFWLDGHFSEGITAIGSTPTPILQELMVIARLRHGEDCLLIDDRRLFTGVNGYPTIEALEEHIRQISKSYIITHDFDCIIATPSRYA